MTTPETEGPPLHPVRRATAAVDSALKDVRDVDPAFMRPDDRAAALVELVGLADRLDELLLRVLGASDDLACDSGFRDAGAWLAHHTRLTRSRGRALQRLSGALDAHPPLREALADGRLHDDQAQEVVRAVEALPTEVGSEVRAQARDHLIALADHHDARDLRRLGKRVLDVVAPEVGEAHEAALLAREEARAWAGASLTMFDDGLGRCHGRFTIPSLAGAMLRQHLMALANPRRHDRGPDEALDSASPGETPAEGGAAVSPEGETPWRSMPERLGAALVEYVERYPADRTPSSGGLAATVVVTIPIETLAAGLDGGAPGRLDTGLSLSPGEARRLLCESAVIPAVLGTDSVPLDLGRQTRFHTKHQRIAIGLRDGHCTAEGCDVPPAGCHVHHDDPWVAARGPTSVEKGRLLCPRHHRMAHRPDYEMRKVGLMVSFVRRT